MLETQRCESSSCRHQTATHRISVVVVWCGVHTCLVCKRLGWMKRHICCFDHVFDHVFDHAFDHVFSTNLGGKLKAGTEEHQSDPRQQQLWALEPECLVIELVDLR